MDTADIIIGFSSSLITSKQFPSELTFHAAFYIFMTLPYEDYWVLVSSGL
jgi:hypothetical protein